MIFLFNEYDSDFYKYLYYCEELAVCGNDEDLNYENNTSSTNLTKAIDIYILLSNNLIHLNNSYLNRHFDYYNK